MAETNNPAQQGTIQRIDGQAWLRMADGRLVALRVGDHVGAGQVIVTASGAHVSIKRGDGGLVDIGSDRTVSIDDSVVTQTPTDRSEAAITQQSTEADRIIAALNAGQDPLADLEAPAAGLAGGGADNGHGFVRLLRIVEDISPLGFERPNDGPPQTDELPTGAANEPAAREEQPAKPLDPNEVTISVAAATITEGGSIVYTVTSGSAPTGSPLVVTLSNGMTVTIPVGATSATSAPQTVRADDSYVQGTDVVTTSVTSATGGNFTTYVLPAPISVNVVDDADATTVSLSATPSVAEGGSIVYTASLSNPAGTAMTVTLSTGATINIAAGSSTGTVSVAAPTEDVYIDAGTVSATISSTTGGNFEAVTISPTAATTSVTDTLNTTTLSLTGAASITEGASGSYALSLTSAAQTAVTVTLSYSGTAANGSDFNGTTTVTIPAGSSSANFTIATIDDALAEGAESFTVSLVSASGGNFENLALSGGAAGSVTTTIVDNDNTPTLTVSSPTVAENGGFAVFQVALSNASATATSFNLTLANGTATAGSDYTSSMEVSTNGGTTWVSSSSGTLAAGSTGPVLVRVPITSDNVDEPDETFTLTATRTAGTTTNTSAIGTGTITDDDAAPTIASVTSNSATEASAIVHTVTLSNASSVATTYTLSLADVTATGGGTDYTSALTNAAFSNGVTISG
ncbi:retention module-containing protein, partial [Viridibacterium curvum]|uniref:retention module-containing protein n=1 Tax=Viridibacterium curvum TaxID=1101404 RepID=UPI0031EC92C6